MPPTFPPEKKKSALIIQSEAAGVVCCFSVWISGWMWVLVCAYSRVGYILSSPGENGWWAGCTCPITNNCMLQVNPRSLLHQCAGQYTFLLKRSNCSIIIHWLLGVSFNFAIGILDQKGCKGITLTKFFIKRGLSKRVMPGTPYMWVSCISSLFHSLWWPLQRASAPLGVV